MQKLSLINSIAYAVGLMLAFVVLTMPFMPIALPVAATLGLVGAVLCLAFTIINNAIKGGIEIYKTYETMKELKADYNDKVNQLRDKSLTSDERKLLFLEIKKLHADTEYQKQMITYQSVNLVRSIMLEVLIPAIIFSSLVFLPLGIGVLALGAALGLAIASHLLVDALFKPEEKKELEFDQEEYDRFCDSLVTTETEKTHGFFKNKNAFKAKAGDDLVLDKEKGIEPSNGDAYSKS